MSSYAFYNCSALKNVYYTGTANEWNNITISTGNQPLTNAAITFNYIKCGDSNGDYEINANDLTVIINLILSNKIDYESNITCDANGDGVINLLDLVRLKKYLAGISTVLGK